MAWKVPETFTRTIVRSSFGAALDGFGRDGMFCAGFLLPSPDPVRCEAGDHSIDIMTVLRLETAIKDFWQVGLYRCFAHRFL
jgi:hypothetical protein